MPFWLHARLTALHAEFQIRTTGGPHNIHLVATNIQHTQTRTEHEMQLNAPTLDQ